MKQEVIQFKITSSGIENLRRTVERIEMKIKWRKFWKDRYQFEQFLKLKDLPNRILNIDESIITLGGIIITKTGDIKIIESNIHQTKS